MAPITDRRHESSFVDSIVFAGYSRKIVITRLKWNLHIYGSIRSHFAFLRSETESNFTYEYSGAYRACSVTNRKGGLVGRPDDHHGLLLSMH